MNTMPTITKEYKETLGKRLKELRTTYGYTQSQVSDYLNMDQSNYSKIEHGKRHLKCLSQYLRLSDLYGCTLEYILCEDDNYEPLRITGGKSIDLEIIAQMNITMNYLKMLRKIRKLEEIRKHNDNYIDKMEDF